MRDKATIVAQIDYLVSNEVKLLEAKIDAKLDELELPCVVCIGNVAKGALDAIKDMYTVQGKWTIEVQEERNDYITLTFS